MQPPKTSAAFYTLKGNKKKGNRRDAEAAELLIGLSSALSASRR